MRRPVLLPPILVAVVLAAGLGACGGGGGGGGNGNGDTGAAARRLADSCVDRRESDRALCRCIADELVAHGATAAGLDADRAAVVDGRRPARVVAAAKACRGRA